MKPTLKLGPTTGPPDPVLTSLGFHGSPADFMARLHALTDAHVKAFGTRPTPGVALDLARSTVPIDHFEPMFTGMPTSKTQARAKAALTAQPADQSVSLVAGLTNAIKTATLAAYINKHHDAVEAAFTDPDTREQLTRAIYAKGINNPAQVLAAAIFPHDPNLLGKVVMAPAKPTEQVTFGISFGLPTLAFEEGKGVVESVKQKSPRPFLKTNAELARATAEGVKRDVTNPKDNVGNLLLDVWGAASLVGGAAARGAAAGKALSEGAGARAVTRAAVSRAKTGTFEVGPGADVPLSSNPLAAKVQSIILDKRAKGMTASGDDTPVPMGAAAVTLTDRAQKIADAITDPFGLRTTYLSTENKIQRQLRTAARIDRDLRMAVMDPALKATRSAVNTDQTIARIGRKRWLGLSAAEQKAIQVLATDDPTPFETWQSFHENAIRNEWGNPADHQAHLSLLPAAQKAAENPSARMVAALDAVKAVMAEQTALRIRELGLTPEIAEGRVASVGQVVRGDVQDASRNAVAPALKSGDEILQLAALGRSPEQIARELVKPNPEAASEMGRPRYSSYESALKAVHAKLATPEAKRALTPERIRSTQKNPDAFYLPFVSAAHTRGHGSFWGMRASKYGIPVPSSLPELNHVFTGDSIRAGDFRVDATNLARESYVRTVHIVSRLNAWKRLWDDYSIPVDEIPPGQADHFEYIRDERAVDDHLKGILSKVDQGELTAKDVDGLTQEAVDNLNRFMFPSKADLQPGEHVRAVDKRLLDDPRSTKPGKVAKTFSAVNEPLRDVMIFLRPSYILNAVNNAAMLAMHEGALAVPNMVRAFEAPKWYGAKETRMLDALAGEGRMLSYSPEDAGRVTKISHALASGWNVITDRLFRRAAVIHELRRQGFRTTAEIKRALNDSLTDPEVKKKVTEAGQRGKQAMVELDNLTWFEKAYLRHFVFVYPWVSRSAVWSVRFLRDHPAQAAIYNEIGQSAEIENDSFLKYLPNWMKDNAVMPVGFDPSGNPLVINPATVDTFSTMGEALGLARGDETLSDLFGPGMELVLHLVTDRDRFGRKYEHRIVGPLLDSLTGLPQVSAYTRAGKEEHPIPPNDLGDIHGLEKQEAAAATNPIYVPGSFMNTYGPLLFGGLTPRVLDKAAVEARFWKNAPYPQKVKHHTDLMLRQAKLQADLIGARGVPADVREGIKLVGARSLAYHEFTVENGRTPNLRDRTEIDIDLLADRHLISDTQQAELHKRLKAAPDDQVDNFRSGVVDKLAYGKPLSDWYIRARTVARIANSLTLDEDLQRLVANKLLPAEYKDAANADEATLTRYGRGFLKYQDGIKRLTDQASELRKKNADTTEVAAKLRAYVDAHSVAVKINGKTLPPYASLALAKLSPKEIESLKVGLYTQPFLNMSATDKALAGYETSPKVTEALTAYAHYTSPAYLATQFPVGERSLDGSQKAEIIKQLDTAYNLHGELVQDYRLSKQPRFKRYTQLNIYKQSPHKAEWRAIFDRAGEIYDAAHPGPGFNASITASQASDAWHEWTVKVLPIIQHDQPEFYAELKPYLEHDPSFLDELIGT